MFDMLKIIKAEGKEVIVLGDMNYDYKTDEYDINNPITETDRRSIFDDSNCKWTCKLQEKLKRVRNA